MNGILSERESRHLTPEEHLRYFELGLCAPPDMTMLNRFRDHDLGILEQVEHERDEAHDRVIELQNENAELERDLLFAHERISHLEKVLADTVLANSTKQTGA